MGRDRNASADQFSRRKFVTVIVSKNIINSS